MTKVFQLVKFSNLVLTPAQKDLYALICEKLKDNKPILYEEAKKIYFEKGCRTMRNGWPHWWWSVKNEETGNYEARYAPYTEEAVKYITFNWLTFNIGKLVVKGALKVIPQIKLE